MRYRLSGARFVPIRRATQLSAHHSTVAGGARYVADGGGTYYDTQFVQNCPIELSNLYGYDAQGRPLAGVRLYDQNGNPFDLSVFGCAGGSSGQFAPDGAPNVHPYPSAPVHDYGNVPTGPPTSLAPLPGATVPSTAGATPPPSASPVSSGAPTPTR